MLTEEDIVLVSEESEVEDEDDDLLRHIKARVGRTLKDKWTLDSLVGVGGMAAVYAATHRNGKQVAVKMLHPGYSADPTIKRRFLQEGYAANKVGHRGAVTVDDDDVDDDGSAFLVMELLDGDPMDSRMEKHGGRLPAEQVLSITEQLLDTMASAHDAGIVHRDLKPENVFLGRDGVVKILDFGIARIRETSGKPGATQAGSLMGTPSFMAPEQARGRWESVDGRTDLWAVGATMFTALTGQFVHEAETVTEALALAVMQPARPIATVDPSVAPEVAAIVDRALAYDAGERFQSAREMREAVLAAYHSLVGRDPASVPSWSSPPPPMSAGDILGGSRTSQATTNRGFSNTLAAPESRARAPRGAIAAAAAFLLLAGGGALAFALSPGDPPAASPEAMAAQPVQASPAPAADDESAETPPAPVVEPAVQEAEVKEAEEAEAKEAEQEAAAAGLNETANVAVAPSPSKPPAVKAAPTRQQRPRPAPRRAAKPAPATKPAAPADPFATRY